MCAKLRGFIFNPDCRHFVGYKPCRFKRLCRDCPEYSPVGKRLLIINLEAMGNVILSTTLLAPLQRKYGDNAHITWITMPNAVPLLAHNPLVDRIIPYDAEGCMIVSQQKFDSAFNIDKAANACALLNQVMAKHKYGYGLSDQGTIVPAGSDSVYDYEMGLNDELKFRGNKLCRTQILQEAMGLTFERDPYILNLTEEEQEGAREYKQANGLLGKKIIGINTGCAPLYRHKTLTLEQHIDLARRLVSRFSDTRIVLLGGKAESELNAQIAAAADGVLNTPTTLGLRRGLGFIDMCDIVITGDTMAMHASIGLKKFVVAYFTITCPQEIDLYDRGVHVACQRDCAPCWKRECDDLRCITELDLARITDAAAEYFRS